MKLTRRKRREYGDSAALSDLAFLLIIYFIVIAGFNVNKGFLMNLPAKDSTRLVLRDDLLRFELDAAGDLFHQGSIMDMDTAETEIRNLAASHPNLAVVLGVNPETPWQKVVSFVGLAQRLEVESFSFTMTDGPAGGGR
ncbi:MAG: biopolymer transporter ExbD [Spirochaetales bacterium]|jgi:biopolymer transport protein ExbD|nr:biopolymer transporter ExbD [Spirochaetales bacterium]